MPEFARHIMLVGGGHAHVAVLADWITNGLPFERATLLTPHRHLRYSGMVPGWIAGQYDRDEALVDVAALARRARVQFVQGPCTGIDPETRSIKTGGGQVLKYDVVSFDTGGVGRAAQVFGADNLRKTQRMIDIRPIDRFVARLEKEMPEKEVPEKEVLASRVAVLGGGAGGVEIAFAMNNRKSDSAQPNVTLVTGRSGLLPGLSAPVRRKVTRELERQGISVVYEDAKIEGSALVIETAAENETETATRSLEPVDLVIACLGSAAPDWPAAGGLATDAQGFIAVDQHQRSVSHPDVFAVGDVAARQDRHVAHSGVHAVMAGPVLARNLRSLSQGKTPSDVYTPRKASLYLLSTGNGSAILSYGRFSAQGRWVAKLKALIDKRWISQYASLSISD